jgi:5-carboxymethyl-2-hydroxymuconate isomerase
LVFAEARRRVGALLEAPHFMLSLEIREIEPGLSWKANSVHGRLRG